MAIVQNDASIPSKDTASISAAEVRTKQLWTAMVQVVRLYMRDTPDMNRLIDGQEHSPRRIAQCVLLAIDEYNITPPLMNAKTSITNFPSVDLLLRGTVAKLMASTGILQTRNKMTYSDGEGIRTQHTENSREAMAWFNLFNQSWKSDVMTYKRALNIKQSYNGSGVVSEYLIVSGLLSE